MNKVIFVTVTGTRERLDEFLDTCASANVELWRKVRKIRNSNEYRGIACYTIDFQ